ncbi:MAG: hypothetical protein H6621_03430 [Halobacteriovoraceae bacterium]|nr:hypothetical protein [Halobacteriovoraceae bacterium]
MGKKVKSGNLWLISYQLQFLYNTIRLFEALLLFVPGLYSFWLRLWGSSIGEKILWAPNVSIIDRNLIDIGDRVLLGNNSYLSSHIIKKRERGRYQIYVKKIKIENDAVISFGSNLSAGVVIGEQSFIPAKSDLYPNTNVLGGENYAQ